MPTFDCNHKSYGSLLDTPEVLQWSGDKVLGHACWTKETRDDPLFTIMHEKKPMERMCQVSPEVEDVREFVK